MPSSFARRRFLRRLNVCSRDLFDSERLSLPSLLRVVSFPASVQITADDLTKFTAQTLSSCVVFLSRVVRVASAHIQTASGLLPDSLVIKREREKDRLISKRAVDCRQRSPKESGGIRRRFASSIKLTIERRPSDSRNCWLQWWQRRWRNSRLRVYFSHRPSGWSKCSRECKRALARSLDLPTFLAQIVLLCTLARWLLKKKKFLPGHFLRARHCG